MFHNENTILIYHFGEKSVKQSFLIYVDFKMTLEKINNFENNK